MFFKKELNKIINTIDKLYDMIKIQNSFIMEIKRDKRNIKLYKTSVESYQIENRKLESINRQICQELKERKELIEKQKEIIDYYKNMIAELPKKDINRKEQRRK